MIKLWSFYENVEQNRGLRQRPEVLDEFHFIAAGSAGNADSTMSHTATLHQQMHAIFKQLTAKIDLRFTAKN